MKSGPGNIFQGSPEEIPQEMLLRYVSGKATPVEQRLIEKQLSDDPFLADALEGLMKIKDTAALQKQLSEIDTAITTRVTRPKHKVLQVRRIALVAASLALLVTAGWFINNSLNKSSQKIFTDEFQPYHEPQQQEDVAFDVAPPVSDSAVKPAEITTPAAAKPSPPTEAAQTSAAENVKAEKKEIVNNASPAQANDESMDIAPQAYTETAKESKSLRAAADTLHDNVVSGVQADSKAPPAAAFSTTEAEEQQVLSKVRDDDKFNAHKAAWDHAMELYHQGNYAAAISEFEIILKDDPDNQACNFYAAVSYLGLENEDAALKKLKKLDNNKSGPYYEASRWYEGLAYVKKGEEKEAIKALEKVVELNGEYKPKAMELLEQLK